MKKFLIFAAAIAISVACAKISDVSSTSNEGTQIGFGTWAPKLTRAEARVQGTSTFLAGDTFAVYGYKDKSNDSDPKTVFDDVVVTASGSPVDAWDYDNHRFWDSNYDKYIFYAISPSAIGTAATVDPQTGEVTSATITFAGDDNDVLVADKKIVNKTDGSGNFNSWGTVHIVFNHAASLVDFKVKKAPSLTDATVKVSAFGLTQIENAGVMSVDDDYDNTFPDATAGHPNISWSTDTKAPYGPADGVTPVDISSPITVAEDTAFNPASPTTPAASTFLINSLVVKPQTFGATGNAASQQLSITYTIDALGTGVDVVEHTSILYLADFDIVDDADQEDTKVASWAPGKHYTFYITIDAHDIKFNAEITDWTAVSGYHYLTN